MSPDLASPSESVTSAHYPHDDVPRTALLPIPQVKERGTDSRNRAHEPSPAELAQCTFKPAVKHLPSVATGGHPGEGGASSPVGGSGSPGGGGVLLPAHERLFLAAQMRQQMARDAASGGDVPSFAASLRSASPLARDALARTGSATMGHSRGLGANVGASPANGLSSGALSPRSLSPANRAGGGGSGRCMSPVAASSRSPVSRELYFTPGVARNDGATADTQRSGDDSARDPVAPTTSSTPEPPRNGHGGNGLPTMNLPQSPSEMGATESVTSARRSVNELRDVFESPRKDEASEPSDRIVA